MRNVEKLILVFQNDIDFQNNVMKCESREQAEQYVREILPEISDAEIKEAVRKLIAQMSKMQQSYLNNEEEGLEAALNSDTTTTVTTVTTITAAASSYAFI